MALNIMIFIIFGQQKHVLTEGRASRIASRACINSCHELTTFHKTFSAPGSSSVLPLSTFVARSRLSQFSAFDKPLYTLYNPWLEMKNLMIDLVQSSQYCHLVILCESPTQSR